MPERPDIDNLLQTGSWVSSRGKSPMRRDDPPLPAERSSATNLDVPKSTRRRWRRRFPPSPSVEDEAEAIAKEHGSVVESSADEEPKNPGDPEQVPVLLEVHEFNPERRFVIVNNAADAADEADEADTGAEPHGDDIHPRDKGHSHQHHHKADSGGKPRSEADSKPRISERRKSRVDLPALDTDVYPNDAESNLARTRSATTTEYKERDYFDRPRSEKASAAGLLSPTIIHSSSRRDREYHDTSRRPSDARGYTSQRSRASSTVEIPAGSRSRRTSDVYGSSRPPVSPRLPSASQPSLDTTSARSTSYNRQRQSPPRDEDGVREVNTSRHHHERHHHPSVVTHEDRSGLLSPESSMRRTTSGRSKSRGNTPLPSPRVTQEAFPQYEEHSPPKSGTLPPRSDPRRPEERPVEQHTSSRSRAPSTSSPPRNRPKGDDGDRGTRQRANSRIPSVVQLAPPIVAALPIPIPGSSADKGSKDRRRSPMPPGSMESTSPTSRRHPPSFDRSATEVAQSLREHDRSSGDLIRGSLSNLPTCPRRYPIAGRDDWLTLPRCENFNICPSCYLGLFATDPATKDLFVEAPPRPQDKRIACSFGSSPWFRLAWWMTKKYGYPELRLIYGLAGVAAKNQPCVGKRQVVRMWYSIKDPRTQHALPDFNLCYSCAKSIEVLLPNLTGVFTPLDSPAEASLGVCSMHYFSSRKRFVEYFDLLESTADKAVLRKSAPNMQSLADKMRELSLAAECARDEHVANHKWFIMKSMPSHTVCEACFDEIVWPQLECDPPSVVAGDFYQKPVRIPEPTQCQLYSENTRTVFKKACRNDDLSYFVRHAKDRLENLIEIEAQIRQLEKKDVGDPWTQEAMDKLLREWKKWE